MYHADLLGGITAKVCGVPRVIWNIRNGDSSLAPSRPTRLVGRLCAAISSWVPNRIVSCSNSGKDFHVRMGYPASRIDVIFNGFDTDSFRPNPAATQQLKTELGIEPDSHIVLNVGRYHPLKNQAGFLAAARLIRDANPAVRFVMCGDRITQDNDELTAEIRRNGLGNCVFQLGRRRDVNFLMAAATLVVSSSLSEGFPNVIAEAMACGTICVATDVGDTREIMGEFGLIVPPGDPGQLADAILGA